MNAIVLNTLTGAVTEYDWSFQSITPTYAGDATGLFTLGGDLDGPLPIVAEFVSGNGLWGDTRKKRVEMVYFSATGAGSGELIVRGRSEEYRYGFPLRETGQSRCQPGRGIRENYLAFGFANPDGEFFEIDRIEAVPVQSATRRV